MTWLTLSVFIGLLILFVLAITVLLFEHEKRAAIVTLCLSLPLLGLYFTLWYWDFPGRDWAAPALVGALLIFGAILILPWGKTESLRIKGSLEPIDERDAIFHRFYRIEPGTREWETYYKKFPDKLKSDEETRKLPPLAAPGSKTYKPLTAPFQIAAFTLIEEISRQLEWKPAPVKIPVEDITERVKGFAKYAGAQLVGCAKLNPAYIYSHIGRSPGEWGAPITLNHKYAMAIAVEMSHDMVCHSPGALTTTETAYKYLEAGKIAMLVARYINLLGYEARAHVDGNYRVLCTPIAADAGIGELGRLGLLITKKYGPRIRLSVVTTNLPLAADSPVSFGVQDFCAFCKKCADICPSGSVDKGEKRLINGVEKWQSNQDTCYRHWRRAGSDCNLCVKVCPYSHPTNPMHNTIRWVIQQNHLARRAALLGDDLLYGRRPKGTYPLPGWHA